MTSPVSPGPMRQDGAPSASPAPARQPASAAPARPSASAAPPVIDGVEWVRPRPTSAQRRGDLWLALVLFGGMLISCLLYRTTGVGDDAPFWHQAIWAATMSLPLAFRRVAPEIVVIVCSVALVIGGTTGIAELLVYNICLFIAVYTVGAWGRSRRIAGLVRGLVVLVMFAWLFWGLIISSNAPEMPFSDEATNGPISPYVGYALINVLTNVLFFGGAWYFGDTAYRSARSRAALEQRTEELAVERERSRDRAVALERLRIARELHDVVAHHVSVIGVQAGAARRVLERDPERAIASLSAIEESAREAVSELHGLLGTLRHGANGGDDAHPPTGPVAAAPHGLDDLDALAAESTANGVPTTIAVIGEARSASTVVALTAYRLVQEALTNVRKHAGPGASAEVRLRWTDDALEVEVGDTGRGRTDAGPAGGAGGLGQVGMRERVAAVGGTLELGARRHGGYLVRASLPARRKEIA
ncbi:sensor histidine kinase [Agromyces aerolatus]|uniref:sensor histidine kinase n=1 Tax=Agromyces sp. LY-1074 TaxID=3074080 RepID=UPI0028606D3F|nr:MULTISPECIES: histidine kinase [unclassified Agromyces]MDR5701123.1 histidine kinase [Agromyces sp. LY-1074]MDR5707763.1 histidine kinase [Agromyces sp. LY-1358]